ncbi:exodeoxyribonuclease V subunit gamma [Serinicoccus sp. LYQ131]|uniref:exodeoxyribonuclease V subunit gamma n=1 Tax=Serinicoccus sp. LYQ131 TaxID=3378797 RepID=UPI0038523FB3
MTLFVHRARDTAVLAAGLAELLATPLTDPFAQEVVAVPAKGVERWLAQRLSHTLGAGTSDDGVCAGIRFLNPHSLVSLVLGVERDDPWHPDRLAWPVLRAVDASLDEEWAATLATHLGHRVEGTEGELRRGRRYAVARRLAGLFATYAAQRPAMVADWRAGGSGDGVGGQIEPDLAWQPELWRRVLDLVDAEPPDVRQSAVVQALAQGRMEDLELPGRLSLFGHTRIARSEIEVIAALGEHRDVHLWLPQSSPAAWDTLTGISAEGPVPRDTDGSALLLSNPLLASLGRDARELQRTLALVGAEDRPVERTPTTGAGGSPAPPSLLSLLQDDLAGDHVPTGAERADRRVGAEDRSVQVHACHGQSRQVEVLRDVLADLLEQDPDLEPRDILVMCPDIDAYAPLLHAGFGLAEALPRPGATDTGSTPDETPSHPAHGLRVRLADRAPLHANPLLRLAAHLVELAGSRLTASEVLDLARSAPVRHRFGLEDTDLERLGDWTTGAGIRWGLDDEHRAAYQLPHLSQNTWRSGLDRILVGAGVDGRDTDHLGTTLALDDLDSGDLDLAGRWAELVARLGESLTALRTAGTADEWVSALRESVLGLASTPPRDAWQVTQLHRELDQLEAAAQADHPVSLSLSDVRALLAEASAGRPTRSNFRTGTLTVCTMVPMRSVPHRVVCLVGLDDGVFPRSSTPDGDDATARRPVTGERDPRSEDRQLLLDAVMAATDTLVVTYTGFDEHTGLPRPPAVPLGELLDALRGTLSPDSPRLHPLVTPHPLQPYDARNLGATGAGQPPLLPGDRPFSYDPSALEGARSAHSDRVERTTPATAVLPAPAAEGTGGPTDPAADIDLEELLRFFDNPARAFLRTRLGLRLPQVPEERTEGIPIELDGLQKWAIGERMLAAVLDGRDAGTIEDAELWRGDLPPSSLGAEVLREVKGRVQLVAGATWHAVGQGGWGIPLVREVADVDLTLPSGRRLTGSVPGMVGPHALTATYSTVRAKQRLRSWVTSLALAGALGPESRSHLVGQKQWGRAKGGVHHTHGPHDPARALELLDQLGDVRDRGLHEPIPLPVATSAKWAQSYLGGPGDPAAATLDANREWQSPDGDHGFPKEQDDPSQLYVHGGQLPLVQILGTPRDDERWEPGVDHRLGQLALRVWRPVLTGDAERTERAG